LPQLPKGYLGVVTRQILSEDQDHLGLFEIMMSNLEADLQKSFKDHLLEKFKISQSPNIVNIYAKFCNMSKDSDDFEKLVQKLYETK
jgi:hypothetical protein